MTARVGRSESSARGEPLAIAVYSDLHGLIRVSPDPAIVTVGTPIEWAFSVPRSQQNISLRWQIYFQHTKPFSWTERSIETESQEIEQAGVLRVGAAKNPGDHKYGVRVIQTDTNEVLGDDDPVLIVLPS